MNLDELRKTLASDATEENKQLREKVQTLEKRLRKDEQYYSTTIESLMSDCEALSQRCWVLTHGSMCCFCALHKFHCNHGWSDMIIKPKEEHKHA